MEAGGARIARMSPLRELVARGGCMDIFESACYKLPSVDAQDEFGWTLAHWAAYYGREDCLRVLRKLGADMGIMASREVRVRSRLVAAPLQHSRHSLTARSIDDRDKPFVSGTAEFDARWLSMNRFFTLGDHADVCGHVAQHCKALHVAARLPREAPLRILLDRVPDTLYHRDQSKKLPLHYAAIGGSFESCSLVIAAHEERLTSVGSKMQWQELLDEALLEAVKYGNRSTFRALYLAGANEKSEIEVLHSDSMIKWNPLHIAAASAQPEMCDYLLSEFPDIAQDQTSERISNTFLELAIKAVAVMTEQGSAEDVANAREAVRILVAAGCFSTPQPDYHEALASTIEPVREVSRGALYSHISPHASERKETARRLPSVAEQGGGADRAKASSEDKDDELDGHVPNSPSMVEVKHAMAICTSGTLLHHVADSECAKLLIGAGFDVNARDKNWSTPLMCAAKGGFRPVFEVLVRAGADLEAKDKNGQSACDLNLAARDWAHDIDCSDSEAYVQELTSYVEQLQKQYRATEVVPDDSEPKRFVRLAGQRLARAKLQEIDYDTSKLIDRGNTLLGYDARGAVIKEAQIQELRTLKTDITMQLHRISKELFAQRKLSSQSASAVDVRRLTRFYQGKVAQLELLLQEAEARLALNVAAYKDVVLDMAAREEILLFDKQHPVDRHVYASVFVRSLADNSLAPGKRKALSVMGLTSSVPAYVFKVRPHKTSPATGADAATLAAEKKQNRFQIALCVAIAGPSATPHPIRLSEIRPISVQASSLQLVRAAANLPAVLPRVEPPASCKKLVLRDQPEIPLGAWADVTYSGLKDVDEGDPESTRMQGVSTRNNDDDEQGAEENEAEPSDEEQKERQLTEYPFTPPATRQTSLDQGHGGAQEQQQQLQQSEEQEEAVLLGARETRPAPLGRQRELRDVTNRVLRPDASSSKVPSRSPSAGLLRVMSLPRIPSLRPRAFRSGADGVVVKFASSFNIGPNPVPGLYYCDLDICMPVRTVQSCGAFGEDIDVFFTVPLFLEVKPRRTLIGGGLDSWNRRSVTEAEHEEAWNDLADFVSWCNTQRLPLWESHV